MLLLFDLLQLFSLVGAQWSQCPTVTVAPSELDTVSIWTDGVVSRLGIAKPTETSTPSSVTASTASLAKCPAECSFPLSTYVTTVGTQSSFLHIQEPLSFLVPGYFTRFPTNETLRCVAYQGSCGATVPLYRHYRITAFGVQHAYSFSPDVGYQDFIMEGNPLCYFWPSGIAADSPDDNLKELPDSELVTLNYFDNQAIGSLRDHYATALTTATGYTQLAALGKVAANPSTSCNEMITVVQMVDNQTGPFARMDHKLIVESQESNRLFEQYTPTGEKFYCVARPVCGASQPLWKMYDYINLDSVMSLTPTSTISAYLYPNAPLCYIWAMDYVGGTATNPSVGPQNLDPSTTENSLLSSTLLPDEGSTVASTEISSPLPEISSTMAEIESSTISIESTPFFEEGTTSLPFESSPMGEMTSTAVFSQETTVLPMESTTELFGTTESEVTTIFSLETGETTEIGSTLPGSTAFNLPASLPTETVGPEGTTVVFEGSSGGPEATGLPSSEIPMESTVILGSTSGFEASTPQIITEITGGIMTEGPTTIGGIETTNFIPIETTEAPITVELGSTVAELGSTVSWPGSTTPQMKTPAIWVESTISPAATIPGSVPGLESTVPGSTIPQLETGGSTVIPITIPAGPTTPMTWESLFSSMTTMSRIIPTVAADVTNIPVEVITSSVENTAPGPTTPGNLPFINITELTKTTETPPVMATVPPSSEITVIPVQNEGPATTIPPVDGLIFTVPNPGITVSGEITVTDGSGLMHNLIEKAVSLEQVIASTAATIRDSTDLFSLNG